MKCLKLYAKVSKNSHKQQWPPNCEFIQLNFDEMKHFNKKILRWCIKCPYFNPKKIQLIKESLSPFTDNEVISSMSWVDPQQWKEDQSYNGITAINKSIEKNSFRHLVH